MDYCPHCRADIELAIRNIVRELEDNGVIITAYDIVHTDKAKTYIRKECAVCGNKYDFSYRKVDYKRR